MAPRFHTRGGPLPQYLRRHAEPEALAVPRLVSCLPRYRHVLAVPAHAEAADALDLLADVRGRGALLILVVNDPEDAPRTRQEQTQVFLARLRRRLGPAHGTCGALSWWCAADLGLICVERTSRTTPLRATEAVGMARKIGADIALHLHWLGRIDSPIIHCTDADARLPQDYFEQTASWPARQASAVYAFRHTADRRELRIAGLMYEVYLRSQVLGLARAGSPYAYHSIGSTIAVHAQAYMDVRGFPRRSSREDFYILNKLAKVGVVERLAGTPIAIQARLSTRVPVGTGQALSRILAGAPVPAVPPSAFDDLRGLLARLRRLATHGRLPESPDPWDPPALHRAFSQALQCSPHPATRLRHLHTWFDALRTRQFIRRRSGLEPETIGIPATSLDQERHELSLTSACRALAAAECVEASGPVGVPLLALCTG